MTRSTALPDESCQAHVDGWGYVELIMSYYVVFKYSRAIQVLCLLSQLALVKLGPVGAHDTYAIAAE